MQYRYLGNSGLRVSILSLGAWVNFGSKTDNDLAYQCFKTAYQSGCNFFDNAEVYAAGKAETAMGVCIKQLQQELNAKRSDLVISTKIFWGGPGPNDQGLSRKHIIEGLDASLKRLQLDYVDIVFCHRPDIGVPLEETVRAMTHVINQGKSMYWGTSEWPATQIAEATLLARQLGLIAPIAEQPQYSMLHRTRFENEYFSLYKDYKYGTTIWSPLACGLLAGRYNSVDPSQFPQDSRLTHESTKWLRDQLLSGEGLNGLEERDFATILRKVEELKPIAKELNCSLAQLALAWCLCNENVSTVITGASRVEQVEENFRALEVLPKLKGDVLQRIETVLANKPRPPKNFRGNK